MTATVAKLATFPVIEVFGPVLQGEGILAGLPTHFVRFGGCDYRCDWCDSMYAVEPAQVRENAERLDQNQIAGRLCGLEPGPEWVTFSGGNPALLRLDPLLRILRGAGWKVAVETQGSRWREWLADVDCLTVSPKPPSSLMVTPRHAAQTAAFMRVAEERRAGRLAGDCIKVVVFDDDDYEYAASFFAKYPAWPRYVSAGTPPVATWGSEVVKAVSPRQVREEIGERYAWLTDKMSRDRRMRDVRGLVQLHVIGFGHARGV